jgi:homoserine/homoserine lactone efflux protein
MAPSTWFAFVAVAVVCIASPGPAVFLAISNGVRYGPKAVLCSSLGNITGVFFVSALAMIGVGALLKASTSAFFMLKLAGAIYLFYLGVKQWRSKKGMFENVSEGATAEYRKLQLYSQAAFVAATNPKAILFFSALFPQFLSPTEPVVPQFAILTSTFLAISFSSLMTYGVLGARVQAWVGTRAASTWPNKLFGGVFMAFGFALLTLRASAS